MIGRMRAHHMQMEFRVFGKEEREKKEKERIAPSIWLKCRCKKGVMGNGRGAGLTTP